MALSGTCLYTTRLHCVKSVQRISCLLPNGGVNGKKNKTYAFLASARSVSLLLWFFVVMEKFQHSLQICIFWNKPQTKQECMAVWIKILNILGDVFSQGGRGMSSVNQVPPPGG